MSLICPTITATSLAEFDKQLHRIINFANHLHIDIMDGEFVPTKSPSLTELKLPQNKTLDVHVMFNNPGAILEDIINIDPNIVILHVESNADIPLIASELREHNIKTGVAILPETSVDSIRYILPHVQQVLIFGGHLGYHGGEADLKQLEKTEQLRKLGRHLEIAWDGGANLGNVHKISEAGVDIINVGQAIHQSNNPKQTFNQLQSLLD